MTGRVPHPIHGKEEIMKFLGVKERKLAELEKNGAPIKRTKRNHMYAEGWALWDFYDQFEENQKNGKAVKTV